MNMKYQKANVEVVDFSGFVNMLSRSKDPYGRWFAHDWADCGTVYPDKSYDKWVIECHSVKMTDGTTHNRESVQCLTYG